MRDFPRTCAFISMGTGVARFIAVFSITKPALSTSTSAIHSDIIIICEIDGNLGYFVSNVLFTSSVETLPMAKPETPLSPNPAMPVP